jgi:hypothetical protein
VPGNFAWVGGGVWGFEGARVVGPGISQILPFHMILANVSKKTLVADRPKILKQSQKIYGIYLVYERKIFCKS